MYFGALDTDSRNPAGTRYSGYMATIERHGLKPEFLFAVKTSERRTGFELANQLLKNSGKLPDALFCHNDDLALGAMMALQQAKLRIPDDISLIGFDDIAESSFSVPGLTTVGGVMHKLATALVGTLRQAIDTNREPIRISIVPQLITRGSTTSRGSTTNKGEAK
ncbi:HTH-type transcriptional repressor PurR [bioreactor metagenome]|uniref:HTH-type transcriptional repressor PurR n=1 Tax=bioreactor metagenome TaxID=1076179 RepID=A0A645HEP9_9ZZZZ